MCGFLERLKHARTRAFVKANLEARLIDALAPSSEDEFALQLAALRMPSGETTVLLAEIAADNTSAVNVKAMAARALLGSPKGALAQVPSDTVASLVQNANPLIRHGVLLGFGDAANWEAVRTFLADEHPLICREAQELLEDQAM